MDRRELTELIREYSVEEPDLSAWPYTEARRLRGKHYGDAVFLRGLIEFTSYCRQDCYYCGLRKSNREAERYRLTREQILDCCGTGYRLGFRTFVLQGGEDPFFTDELLCGIVSEIKRRWPDCAVTLSAGERSRESYRVLRAAGADRYLLRHESADATHYTVLHPPAQRLESRRRCLFDLKELGFQTGAGFMVGSPGQEPEQLAEDLCFLRELGPHMVGIGPFLPHHQTPFAAERLGGLGQVLLLLALTRLMLPDVLLPATTALGSMHPQGRERGFQAGANVVMPNLSPGEVREAYNLYDGKLSSGAEAAEGLAELGEHIRKAGLRPDFSRGDHAEQRK
ncbi:MAG: [FeFe] hydrogenase H-cluster radical SAM maturase HydE [Oscillospiraceae bacterium]